MRGRRGWRRRTAVPDDEHDEERDARATLQSGSAVAVRCGPCGPPTSDVADSNTPQSMPSAPTLEQLAAKEHEGSIFNAFPAIGTAVVDGTTRPSHIQLRLGVGYHLGQLPAEWVQERLVGPWKPLLGKDGECAGRPVCVRLQGQSSQSLQGAPHRLLDGARRQAVAPISFAPAAPALRRQGSVPVRLQAVAEPTAARHLRSQLLGCDKYLDPAIKVEFGNGGVSFEFHHVSKEVTVPPAGPLFGQAQARADNMHDEPRERIRARPYPRYVAPAG